MSGPDGIILRGIGGFYYVKTADGVLECYAKGIFRKKGMTPLAGDRVRVEGSREGHYVVSDIEERTNYFLRPPVANVDNVFLVISSLLPKPNWLVIDKQTALCELRGVRPVLVLSKTDIEAAPECAGIYRKAGYEVIDYRSSADESLDLIRERMRGKLSVFTGNSGVGKSTLINLLCPGLSLETGEESKKLGRGRHTTRAVELYEFEGGYVADTPGFSDIELAGREQLDKEQLADLFPDIGPHADGCMFSGCSHTVEKGCSVLAALEEGKISPSRHESYCALYREIAGYRAWR